MATLDRRTFPEEVDFVTSPGHRYRGRSRAELGIPGAGPVRVLTDRAILDADEASGELVLAAIFAGENVEDVRARVGWTLRVREPLEVIA